MAEANTPSNNSPQTPPGTAQNETAKAPEEIKENVKSTSTPEATDLPTANAPDPAAVNPGANPNSATVTQAPAPESTAPQPNPNEPTDANQAKPAAKRPPKAEGDAPPAKAKKEKAPALEDKPFADFIQQDFLPALKAGLEKQGVQNSELKFEKGKINVVGFSQAPECWQVKGHWGIEGGQSRDFNLYFFDETINGQKGFSCVESGGRASTLESFRIDERKSDLGLLVFWTLQRLNAQKWLVRN
jgi:hypothetical protein